MNLKQNGVEYLEIRSLDLDPDYNSGIDKHTLGFIHLVAQRFHGGVGIVARRRGFAEKCTIIAGFRHFNILGRLIAAAPLHALIGI